jgi:hypothetical protein
VVTSEQLCTTLLQAHGFKNLDTPITSQSLLDRYWDKLFTLAFLFLLFFESPKQDFSATFFSRLGGIRPALALQMED